MVNQDQIKPFTYGDGEAIRILVADRMGLKPSHIENARQQLSGARLHPMVAAAMSNEATRIHNLLRLDPEQVHKANAHAEDIMQVYSTKARVLQLLRNRGWTAKAGRPDFVAKEFKTCVGPRVASAWCTHYNGEGLSQFWLKGQYWSEGRCALAACSSHFDASAEELAIMAAVDKFVRDAEEAIASTYAIRLLGSIGEPGA